MIEYKNCYSDKNRMEDRLEHVFILYTSNKKIEHWLEMLLEEEKRQLQPG
jgi:hypothetical protein